MKQHADHIVGQNHEDYIEFDVLNVGIYTKEKKTKKHKNGTENQTKNLRK